MSSPSGARNWTVEEKKETVTHMMQHLQIPASAYKELSDKLGRPVNQIRCQWIQTLKPDIYKKIGLDPPAKGDKTTPKKGASLSKSPSMRGRVDSGPCKRSCSESDSDE